jgi:hypothetical protein
VTDGMNVCRVRITTFSLTLHSLSLRVNCVLLCPVRWQVQVLSPCGQDMYRLASWEVQNQVHNCSAEKTTKHYLQVYLKVQQLQELMCRHFKVCFLQTVQGGTSSAENRYELAARGGSLSSIQFMGDIQAGRFSRGGSVRRCRI